MWKRIISLSLLLFLISTTTALAHTAEVQISGDHKYKAIRLTPEIYHQANSDLSDLLIKDSKDEQVPYFIHTGFQKTTENRELYKMEMVNSYLKGDHYYFDYKLAQAVEHDIVVTSMEVSTMNTNFVTILGIYGSYDNIYWEYVQDGKLYDIDDQTKLNIDFDRAQKYTHYRFELNNNQEKIYFDQVNLIYSVKANEKHYFIENLSPQYSIEENGNKTLINIEGLKNLRLCDITLETEGIFKRTVKAPFSASQEIYRLSLNDTLYTDTTLAFNWQVLSDDTYVIAIANNDDKPIDINGITVRYYAEEVVFEANENEQYTLHFGFDETKVAPVYDITEYKEEILKSVIDQAALGIITIEQVNIKMTERNDKVIFDFVVLATAVILGTLILFRLKRKPE